MIVSTQNGISRDCLCFWHYNCIHQDGHSWRCSEWYTCKWLTLGCKWYLRGLSQARNRKGLTREREKRPRTTSWKQILKNPIDWSGQERSCLLLGCFSTFTALNGTCRRHLARKARNLPAGWDECAVSGSAVTWLCLKLLTTEQNNTFLDRFDKRDEKLEQRNAEEEYRTKDYNINKCNSSASNGCTYTVLYPMQRRKSVF